MSLLDQADEAKKLACDLIADNRGPHVATREEVAAALVLMAKIAETAHEALEQKVDVLE